MNMITQENLHDVKLAKRLAAEDIQIGTYISIINESFEYPSFVWCLDSDTHSRDEPIRIQFRSKYGGYPLRVVDVCLPYVYVKIPCGYHRTFDTYSVQFVQLDSKYAKRVWKNMKAEISVSSKKKKRKKKTGKKQK